MGDSENKKKAEPKKTSFFKGVKSEFKKIIWPEKDKLVRETTAVVIATVILSIVIALIDTGIKLGVDKILQIG